MTAKKTERADRDGAKESELTFEKALERLEKIVAEMEDGSLGLEAMITRFEEGQRLIKFCSTKLNEVERKIEILVKKGDAIEAEPFDETGGEVEPGAKDEGETTLF